MGIYDRDYERQRSYDDSPGFHLGSDVSWTTKLVIVMAIVYVVQLLTDLPTRPAMAGSPTSYSLARRSAAPSVDGLSPRHVWLSARSVRLKHILFNAFGLWMFGRSVEGRYGEERVSDVLLGAVVVSRAWHGWCRVAASGRLDPRIPDARLTRVASPAVLLLFCLNLRARSRFSSGACSPCRPGCLQWCFWADLLGASAEGHVAYTAHLAAHSRWIYFKAGWRLSDWLPGRLKLPKLGRRPPLRVHDPADDADDATDDVVDTSSSKSRHGQTASPLRSDGS